MTSLSGCSIVSVLLLQLLGHLPGVFGVSVCLWQPAGRSGSLLSHGNSQPEAAGLVLTESSGVAESCKRICVNSRRLAPHGLPAQERYS